MKEKMKKSENNINKSGGIFFIFLPVTIMLKNHNIINAIGINIFTPLIIFEVNILEDR